jgi:hypothetical protein
MSDVRAGLPCAALIAGPSYFLGDRCSLRRFFRCLLPGVSVLKHVPSTSKWWQTQCIWGWFRANSQYKV